MSAKTFLPISARYNPGSKQRMRPIPRPVGKAVRPMPASMQARRPAAESGTKSAGKLLAWFLGLFKRSPAPAPEKIIVAAPQPVKVQPPAPRIKQGFTPLSPASVRPAHAQASIPAVRPVAVSQRPVAGSFERRPQRRVELPEGIKGPFGDMKPKTAPKVAPVAEFSETLSTPPCAEPCAVSPAREMDPGLHGGVPESPALMARVIAPEPMAEPGIACIAAPNPAPKPGPLPVTPAAQSPMATGFALSTIPEDFPTEFIVMNRDDLGASQISSAGNDAEREMVEKIMPIPLERTREEIIESAGIAIPIDVAHVQPVVPAAVAVAAIASGAERMPVLSKDATPADIVKAAVQLEGVEGALVALPDGLRVASQLDPALDANLLSAMLPKAYLNMRTWTKNLQLGELSELSFTAGDRSWKILRVKGLYFAAFGKAGSHLPADDLTQLATRLNSWEGH